MRKILLLTGAAVVMRLIAATPALATSNKNDDHKIGICHATGSKTNPYVYINVDQHAADAHARHQDGRDIIGVKSAKDCPKGSTATTSPKPSTSPSPSVKPGQGGGEVLGSSTENKVQLPATLPQTGGGAAAGLSALMGVPAMGVAGRAYLRSRKQR
jgi:hypothetical protein